jgi:hypothetical protein
MYNRQTPAAGGRCTCGDAEHETIFRHWSEDNGRMKFPFAASVRISLSSVRFDTTRRSLWFFRLQLFRPDKLRRLHAALKLPPPIERLLSYADLAHRLCNRRTSPAELQPVEASIQSLRASLVSQPTLILQFKE